MKKRKSGIAATAVALAVLTALFVFLTVWFFGAKNAEFDAAATEEAELPGLESGISPQGLCPVPENGGGYRYAMSGYLPQGASRIYFFGGNSAPKYVTLLDEAGKPLSTHFGGMTCTGKYFVVASGKSLVRFSVEEALSAADGAALSVTDCVRIEDVRSIAYCYYYDGLLYAGEFYRSGNYETDESHRFDVAGGKNYGLVFAYAVDEAQKGGLASETPEFVLSVRAQVQGIAVWDGGIALSTSYGLADSKIYFYKPLLGAEGDYRGIPLHFLDDSDCVRVLTAPCMSEEIFADGTSLHILFESLSKKYRYFVRRRIDSVLSVPLS